MSKIWFTSDWHLGHRAIIPLQSRPFENIADMCQTIVENTNRLVHAEDRLFILGDLAFRSSLKDVRPYLESLRCRHISLVLGNHDQEYRKDWERSGMFEEVGGMLRLLPEAWGYRGLGPATLTHYRMLDWEHSRYNGAPGNKPALNLHGHIHSDGAYNCEMRDRGILRYDVGVDAHGFAPVSLDQIMAFFSIVADGQSG